MLRLAHWKISADLCNDQPLDACGYIAADAVCRLREAALSEANSWHDIQLPDYAQLECISRGNKALRKKGDHRILDTNQVNSLVRNYSHIDQSYQAAEEWWAGAVALDYFLTGLPNVVAEITTTNPHTQHRWRAWAVNTQTSRQHGSHWFTVVVGTQIQELQSTGEHQIMASSLRALDTVDQLPQSTGEHEVLAFSSQPLRATHYPNVFGSPNPALSDALLWARTHARQLQVAAWLDACSQWDSAIAAGEHMHQKKRRTLCKAHGIPCTRLINNSNNELDAAMKYIRRELVNRIHQIRATTKTIQPLLQSKAHESPSGQHVQQPTVSADVTLHPRKKTKGGHANKLNNYFAHKATGTAPTEIETLDIADVATDVRSTYLHLQAKRHIYAEDKDFNIVKDTLSELRGYVNFTRLRKMTSDPPKTPKTIRHYFKERSFATIAFDDSKSPDEATGAQEATGAHRPKSAARHNIAH